METVVLPAQDHLAQERDRQQGGVMSGMIYSLGGLPRTRRKMKSPHQVFGEKFSDRRKGLDRRPVEKRPVEKSSTVLKNASVITILRRPQTKEAAAENIALFTGRPIEGVTKQILKSALAMSQHVAAQTVVEVELVKGVEVSGRDGETNNALSRSSTNVSPKKGTKKKPLRDLSAKAASRAATEVAQAESRRTEDAELHGDSRRPKTAPGPVDNSALVERRRSGDTERCSDEHKIALEPDIDEVFKSLEREFNLSHVSPSGVDEIVLTWSDDGVSTIPGVLHPGPSDSLIGEIGQAFARQGVISRSGSFQDASRVNDDGVELCFLPSSPPKRSERWAGPAYTNSPPPSTLPFPTFPLQREKSSMTEVTLADVFLLGPRDTNLETVCSSAPPSPPASRPSPPRVASLLFSATAMQSPFVNPSSATKDLRRMLNLDVEDGFDVSADWSEGGLESATQSLKRMLQLG